jgi:hemerythrin
MFAWKSEYDTGIPEIDAQHKQVFAIAGELHPAMVAGADKTALGAILTRLLSYSRMHFDTEEDLMQASHYPEYAQHKAEHDALTGQVRAFQQSFDAGRAEMTLELVQFLNDWLGHHITDPDRKMSSHVRRAPL